MKPTHAPIPSLRSLIEHLQVDALRVAAEKKSWERRPSAGGYGSGRQRQDGSGMYGLAFLTGDRWRRLLE
jgi:hypothetical protein